MIFILFRTVFSALSSHRALTLENLALRHQFDVLKRNAKRPRLTNPGPLGSAIEVLGRLAKAVDPIPTRDRHPMAQARAPSLLEMEKPPQMAGTAAGS
jgi:hypothetical protein